MTPDEREMLLETPAVRELLAEMRERCARAADKRADDAYARFEVLGHDHKSRDMIECCEGRAVAAAIRALPLEESTDV